MTLAEQLQATVDGWARLDHPALLERFVVRNGKTYQHRATPKGMRGEPKYCFVNAAHVVLARPRWHYVEGFFYRPGLIPIHHAWVARDDDLYGAIDVTLVADAGDEYVGVAFDAKALRAELLRLGVYGLLDTGMGMNTRLMFERDPALKAIVDVVATKRRAAS